MDDLTALLIIDPQVDFCDPAGALYVGGAEHDMRRLTQMVARVSAKVDTIYVTLDSHHDFDIAHPVFWQDEVGAQPAPFTTITVADIEAKRWVPARPQDLPRALDYVRTLERHGRYQLTIWPPHCLIGSSGHNIVPELRQALSAWEREHLAEVHYVFKGMNVFTEHYSALRAEVPNPLDPATQLNVALVESLQQADQVIVAGEAGSHCLLNTVKDLAELFEDGRHVASMVLLTDATSAVTGFEKNQQDFITEMAARGMRLSTTSEWKP